jgi:hypothetical protein
MDEMTKALLEQLERRVTRIRILIEKSTHEHRAHELVERSNLMLRMCIANYEYAVMQNGNSKEDE